MKNLETDTYKLLADELGIDADQTIQRALADGRI